MYADAMTRWASIAVGAVVLGGVVAVAAATRGGGTADEPPGASAGTTSVAITSTATVAPTATPQDRLIVRTVPQRDLVEGEPRALTPEECAEARPRMEAQAALREPKIASLTPSDLPAWQAAVAESRAWFDAGCPLHGVLGYYPSTDGGSFTVILIDF
jgi:hypothetical protein